MNKLKISSKSLKKELNRIYDKVSQSGRTDTAVASARVSHARALDLVEKQTPQYLSNLAKKKEKEVMDRSAEAVFRLGLKVAREQKQGKDDLLNEISTRILTVHPNKKGVSTRNLYRLIERHEINSGRSFNAEIK